MIRFAHLSDIHLSADTLKDAEEFFIKALIKDLEAFNSKKAIDLIFFTGDIVDKGGKSFDSESVYGFLQFEYKVINPLCEKLNLKKWQIFFCPGNHDIDRDVINETMEIGLYHQLNSIEKVNCYIDSGKKNQSCRMSAYKTFEKNFYNEFPGSKQITDFQSSYKFELNGIDVGIVCLNSSWRCADSLVDKGRLLVGERQITEARKLIEGCQLKLGLVHHPVDYLSTFEQKNISNLITKDFDFLFCGHTHESSIWAQSSILGNLFISCAPSNWSYNLRNNNKHSLNGYSIVDYEPTFRGITVYSRQYSHPKESYVLNPDLCDENGRFCVTLPGTEETTKRSYELTLAEKIKEMYFEQTNEHLITYRSDTKAPKDIENLFVLPSLVEKTSYNPEEPETNYDLKTICESNANLLLIGTKECGKTVLLNRLLVELTNNIKNYKKIPVLVKFTELPSRLETAISKFLGIGITHVENFLTEHKVVILLDDISFGQRVRYQLKKIEDVMAKFPSIQFIASCNTNIEGEIPIHLLENNEKIASHFKMVFIKNFKTRQIKQLMEKWFSKDIGYDANIKLEKILSVFSTLNLPRTPLAVSLFLWILEQQDSYKPVNNATMLENFIERLFKKFAQQEIYSEEFDYKNKERLLADIAKRMYKDEHTDYRITYKDLINHIHDYLRKRKFHFEEEEVLKDFLIKGILVKEFDESEVYVRFRFNCFFQYFLMKNLDQNSEFKEYVLREENYLHFCDELEYYTGLKRDQADILSLVVDRMVKEFKDIIGKINRLSLGFDTIFEETSDHWTSKVEKDSFINEISARGKPSEADLEDYQDKILDSNELDTGIEQKKEISPLDKLAKSWILAAKILKNTEETEIENLKSDSYEKVLKCSLAFANVYKLLVMDYISDNDNQAKETLETVQMLDKFLPMLHQMALYRFMGTKKLSTVIREKMSRDFKATDGGQVSELEKYMSVFLLADMKENDYLTYIELLIKESKRTYIKDVVVGKILLYYFISSNNKTLDKKYQNLIAEAVVSSQNLKKQEKGRIISHYQSKKLLYKEKEDGTLGKIG
ncbi:MAG: metallophosphoesterase [Peptococcaceae bacterium]|nr:metallophosphoesterase [Peptococcaceae bacterium]